MIDFLLQLAGAISITGNDVQNVPRISGDNLLAGILTTVYYVAGILCVVTIIFGGILYTISQGDSGKVQTAKNTILYSLVGLVFVLLAFAITQFVIGAF